MKRSLYTLAAVLGALAACSLALAQEGGLSARGLRLAVGPWLTGPDGNLLVASEQTPQSAVRPQDSKVPAPGFRTAPASAPLLLLSTNGWSRIKLPATAHTLPGLSPSGTNALAFNRQAAESLPKPGVYESRPYTCIVVVPGPHLDDGCLIQGGVAAPAMPMAKPDLRLVPRK